MVAGFFKHSIFLVCVAVAVSLAIFMSACPLGAGDPGNGVKPTPVNVSSTPRPSPNSTRITNSATPISNSSTPVPSPLPTSSVRPTPPPSPTAQPTFTAQPSPTVQSIDSIRDSMSVGNIAFNKPKEMTLEESSEIQLVLSPTVTPDELRSIVTSPGEVQTKEISVSDYMEATLSGENFKIVNATQRKLVSTKGVTEWRWDVTPTKSGPQRLHLTLNAIVNYKDGEKPLELRSFHEMIEVNVTFSQRFFLIAAGLGTHLQWLVPSLLIPLSLWGWNRWKKRKKPVAEPELEDTAEPDAPVEPAKTKRTTSARKKK